MSNLSYTTEKNSTLASGGTAETALAANVARRVLEFQNQSTGDLYVSPTRTAASAVGILVPAGSYKLWEAHEIPTGAISVWGATTGQAYYIAEG